MSHTDRNPASDPDNRGRHAEVFESYNTRESRKQFWLNGNGAAGTIVVTCTILALLIGDAWLNWMLHNTCPP